MRPNLNDVPSFYHGYINAVHQDDVNDAITESGREALLFLKTIPDDRWEYRYAEGKWSIKELIQHLIDGERIFSYRALRFARLDATELPGFDENQYTPASKADSRSKEDLMKEFEVVRRSSELLFASFDDEQLSAKGIANGNSITVLAIGFVIAGHLNHHLKIIKERYL